MFPTPIALIYWNVIHSVISKTLRSTFADRDWAAVLVSEPLLHAAFNEHFIFHINESAIVCDCLLYETLSYNSTFSVNFHILATAIHTVFCFTVVVSGIVWCPSVISHQSNPFYCFSMLVISVLYIQYYSSV